MAVKEQIESSVDGTNIVFRSFEISGARKVDGYVFPFGLELSTNPENILTVDKAAKAIRDVAERGIITDLLNKHGALLIRGVHDVSAKTFSTLIHASEEGRGRKPYEQVGFSGSRTVVDKEVFSASEAPSHVSIGQHNENAIHTRFPANIHFYCVKKAPKGGASPLAHSGELFDRVNAEMPDFVKGLNTKGLLTVETYQAPGNEGKDFPFTWAGQSAFGKDILPGDNMATMKNKAEKEVARLTSHFWWHDDNSLEVHEHVPGLRRSPKTGRSLWFNSIAARFRFAKDRGAAEPPYIGDDGVSYPPTNYRYRDGTLIPMEYLARLCDIIDEIKVSLMMGPGDLVLVDNYQVSHGRDPWFDGERVILVSMWDTDNPEERIRDY